MKKEPLIHSDISDATLNMATEGGFPLAESHPLVNEKIYCKTCINQIYDGAYRENDMTWVETGIGNYCLSCFFNLVVKINEETDPHINKAIWGYDLKSFGFGLDIPEGQKNNDLSVDKILKILLEIKKLFSNINELITNLEILTTMKD